MLLSSAFVRCSPPVFSGEEDSADSDIDKSSEDEGSIDGEGEEKEMAKKARNEKVCLSLP